MEKIIATHEAGNTKSSYGFIVSRNYNRSLKHFKHLAAEAQKDFPNLTEADIECFIVTHSNYNRGLPGVRFRLEANTQHPDYHACERVQFFIA